MKFFFVRNSEVDYNCTLLGAGHVLIQAEAGPNNGQAETFNGKQLNDLPDDVQTKVTGFYYSNPREALIKGLSE
jgi:hypothetical protein